MLLLDICKVPMTFETHLTLWKIYDFFFHISHPTLLKTFLFYHGRLPKENPAEAQRKNPVGKGTSNVFLKLLMINLWVCLKWCLLVLHGKFYFHKDRHTFSLMLISIGKSLFPFSFFIFLYYHIWPNMTNLQVDAPLNPLKRVPGKFGTVSNLCSPLRLPTYPWRVGYIKISHYR